MPATRTCLPPPEPDRSSLDPADIQQTVENLLRTVRNIHDWLRSFHAVGETGSYYHAARAVGLAAGANVKRHIERLEEVWGAKLVKPGDRDGTPLTPLGDALYAVLRPRFSTGS